MLEIIQWLIKIFLLIKYQAQKELTQLSLEYQQILDHKLVKN
jgi:hypothetical protein